MRSQSGEKPAIDGEQETNTRTNHPMKILGVID